MDTIEIDNIEMDSIYTTHWFLHEKWIILQ